MRKFSEKGKQIAEKPTGEKCEWFENGNKRLKAFYQDGQKEGEFCTFWLNGKNRRKDRYEMGKLIEGNCFDSLGNKLPDYFPYETIPRFPGGDRKLIEYLISEVRYPPKAFENKIQGRVLAEFYVEPDGSVSDIRVIKSVNYYLDLEAIRVIKKCQTGYQEHRKVKK